MQPSSIPHRACSGRGTIRRSRMVEGKTRLRLKQDEAKYRISIVKNLGGWNPQGLDAYRLQPFIPGFVTVRPIAARVRLSIDFDGEPRITAEEIEHEWPGRMLASKLQSVRPLT